MITTIACAAALLLSSGTDPHDLNGTWVPDAREYRVSKRLKQADPGAEAPPAATGAPQLPVVRIRSTAGAIDFEYLDADGALLSRTTVTTDGAENRNERAGGAVVHRSNARWVDGVLEVQWQLERGGVAMIKGQDRWRLADDGASLTLTTQTEDAKSVSESTIVYRIAEEIRHDAALSEPGPPHEALARLAGTYTTHTKYVWAPGKPPEESRGTAKLSMILDGRFLIEEDRGQIQDSPSSGFRIYGYNNGTKRYEAMWVYTMSSALLTMSGQAAADGRSIDFAASFEESPGKHKKLFVNWRTVSDDEFVIALSGETPEDPRVETTYRRR